MKVIHSLIFLKLLIITLIIVVLFPVPCILFPLNALILFCFSASVFYFRSMLLTYLLSLSWALPLAYLVLYCSIWESTNYISQAPLPTGFLLGSVIERHL